MKKTQKSKGFTLIELMIVVAIIGILAAVAIPKFADLVTKSKEASVKGTLGSVRSALTIYYGDTEGEYPGNLFDALTIGGRYMPLVGNQASLGKVDIPKNPQGNPGHQYGQVDDTDVEEAAATNPVGDADAYSYNRQDGNTLVNCSHVDTKSQGWTTN